MYEIINDQTMTREQRLIAFLNRLFKEKSITKQFHKTAFLKSSNPGRLYGLAKVHKSYTLLRPVLSALETFNYELGKALTEI
ncbi:unnamed protein product [Adineta steineri]|uniref:Uncharacterized protein n=1 Tax=Adineta steineri TaxID=433720 RepID=A0A819VGQ1_9BILA|nr:unnamed protein product [Adineta steineri]CAF1059498.1 unnamed protein product [Adineta steineri]CAF1163399.1 unnamed protein product [Adineta steineri]CAF3793872.1 unnamed protein product [Adineta steineri]CAF4108506.1 unnamed protein product [Adineta steineri]